MIKGIEFDHSAWCEHCGELEPFDATYNDGGTYWCIPCAGYGGDLKLTDDDMAEIEIEESKRKIKYFRERIKGIQDSARIRHKVELE